MNRIILIFLISSQIVLAQSNLPKCQGSDFKKYNNCFGEVADQDGNYKGEFKNGKYHGQGTGTFDGRVLKGTFADGEYAKQLKELKNI